MKNNKEGLIPHPMDGTESNGPQAGDYMKGGNFPGDNSKDSKYYDEGRDGDYNMQDASNLEAEAGDENYADEQERIDRKREQQNRAAGTTD